MKSQMPPSCGMFVGILVLSFVLSLPANADDNTGSLMAAEEALIKQGQKVDLLALGERHWSVPEHRFLTALLRDPKFPSVFPTIVVEFGNAFYQKTIDRYLAGEDISRSELAKVWQDTIIPMAWDSPLYAEFFETVRDVNKHLRKAKKMRVFLGDPPVNWSLVKDVEGLKPFMDRDAFYAEVITQNCGRGRCLLICGAVHFQRKDPLMNLRPPSVHKNVIEYYTAKAGNTKTIESVLPLCSQTAPFTAYSVPSLISTHAPPLNAMTFGQVDASPIMILKKVDGETRAVEVRADDTLQVSEVFDWVLYLGKEETQSEPSKLLYQNKIYIQELYRRSKIVSDAFGFDLTADVKAIDPDAKP
jgi:hypothetical protein